MVIDMKKGKVMIVAEDHVLIAWDDESTDITDFFDRNKKKYKIGDTVTSDNQPVTWIWSHPQIIEE